MITFSIKSGATISQEDFEAIHKEIIATHLIIQKPKRGKVTVRIRKLYNEKGERVNGSETFFYVQCDQRFA